MIETEGITHIHLVVRDIARSLRFYQHVFGMQELFREGPTLVFLRTPGAEDTLTLNEDPALRDRAGENGGVRHFGFRLLNKADLDRAVREVEAAGGRLLRRGEHEPGHPFAYVVDPDGYTIEL
jgi:catechol 2,3-dioxygenase-like lactoylglutathione lyase family enzyme